MTVLAYLMVPVLVVAAAASYLWFRNRQPTSLESGVDSFRREMDALSPDAAPSPRRPAEGADARREARGPSGPRRPPSTERRR